jgi:tetratricopeptide (TPR) repeat protein
VAPDGSSSDGSSEHGEQDDAWEAAQVGAELIVEGEHERAIEVLRELLAREPSNEHASYYLGAAHFERAEYPESLAAYVRALQLAPTFLGAMIGSGHTLRMLGRYEQAIRMAQEVLRLAKDDPDALFLLGTCHFAIGNKDAAEKALERFLATRPEIEVALEVSGMLQVLRGEVVDAEPSEEPD